MEFTSMMMQVVGTVGSFGTGINTMIQTSIEAKVVCGAFLAVAFVTFIGGLLLSRLNAITKLQLGE